MNRTIYEKLEGDGYFNTSMEVLPGEQINSKCFDLWTPLVPLPLLERF